MVLSGLLISVLICSFSCPISSLSVSNTGEFSCVPLELMRLIISLISLSSGETVISDLLTSVLTVDLLGCSFSSSISSLKVSNTGEPSCVPLELMRLMIFLSSEASLVFSREIFLIASLISLMPVERECEAEFQEMSCNGFNKDWIFQCSFCSAYVLTRGYPHQELILKLHKFVIIYFRIEQRVEN